MRTCSPQCSELLESAWMRASRSRMARRKPFTPKCRKTPDRSGIHVLHQRRSQIAFGRDNCPRGRIMDGAGCRICVYDRWLHSPVTFELVVPGRSHVCAFPKMDRIDWTVYRASRVRRARDAGQQRFHGQLSSFPNLARTGGKPLVLSYGSAECGQMLVLADARTT